MLEFRRGDRDLYRIHSVVDTMPHSRMRDTANRYPGIDLGLDSYWRDNVETYTFKPKC